jgi:hypothetical protein
MPTAATADPTLAPGETLKASLALDLAPTAASPAASCA